MLITSILYILVLRYAWSVNSFIILLFAPILVLDIVMTTAAFSKFLSGFISVLLGLGIFTAMIVWYYYTKRLEDEMYDRLWTMFDLRRHLRNNGRTSGFGVYVGTSDEGTNHP